MIYWFIDLLINLFIDWDGADYFNISISIIFLRKSLFINNFFCISASVCNFSRNVGKSLKNTNTEDGSFTLKLKKGESNKLYPRVALNKTLGFLVSAEEMDKATLKNYQNKASDADIFNIISDSKYNL